MAFTQAGGWNSVTSMELASASVTARAPSRAAQYVRMSTEHQQYSPENQLDIIRQYAAAHNMEIVQEYSDHGRSGLNIAGRNGLNQLMADVRVQADQLHVAPCLRCQRLGTAPGHRRESLTSTS
jgi:predicted site-specific integrase-resolvase